MNKIAAATAVLAIVGMAHADEILKGVPDGVEIRFAESHPRTDRLRRSCYVHSGPHVKLGARCSSMRL